MQVSSSEYEGREHPAIASAKEREQQRSSLAHSFDQLVGANLKLTKQVGHLVFVSWVMIFFHAALLIFMIWRR